MLILFLKSQLGLFDMPTMIAGSVKKDGTVTRPHVGMRKKRIAAPSPVQADMFGGKDEAKTKRRAALEALLRKYGGASQVAAMMHGVSPEQKTDAIAKMAKIARVTPAEMQAALDAAKPEDAPQMDLFAAPVPKAEAPKPEPARKPGEFIVGDLIELKGKKGRVTAEITEVRNKWDQYPLRAKVLTAPRRDGWYEVGKVIGAHPDRVKLIEREVETGVRVHADSALDPGSLANHLQAHDAISEYQASAKLPGFATVVAGRILAIHSTEKRAVEWATENAPDSIVQKISKTDAEKIKRLSRSAQAIVPDPAPAPEFDVSTRTDDQLRYLAANGKPGKKEAAIAELKRRGLDVGDTNVGDIDQVVDSAPVTPASTHDSTLPFGVAAGISKADRRRLNAAAAELVADKTTFDDRDREILRQYSGNGGCGDSLNEFYTDPAIAKSIWDVAGRLGFESGTCLEPSCGTGVFLHTAPAGFKVTGIELDPTSASIATALHGDRHEIVNASMERFATQDMRQFNVVVGNPPYGPRGMLAKDDKVELSKAEEYFIDTSLDKTLPGGLCVMVVPAGIMDSKNGRSFRERILRKAEFLGAQRMPNTAFEAAHTDVTADILYFRKRPDDVAGALGTVDQKTLQSLNVWDGEFLSGSYFEGRGAENVFGTVGTAMRAFGEIYTVDGSMRGVPEEVAKFEPHPIGANPSVPEILDALGDDDKAKNRALNAAEKRPYQDTAKVGDIRMIDGVAYVLQGSPARWHRVDEAIQTDAVTDGHVIAARIDTLMAGGEVDREQLQADLKAWVATHGIPAKNPNLLVAAATDKTLYRLIGAVGTDGELSDVVKGRRAVATEGGFDTIARALALNHDSGAFTHDELAASLGQDKDEVLDRLVADTAYAYQPNTDMGAAGSWAPMDVYLTGELWPKLDEVRAALGREGLPAEIKDKLELQARRLEETIDPKSLEDVEIRLNSAFLPTSVLEAWLNAKVDAYKEENKSSPYAQGLPPAVVTFDKGVYSVTGGMWGNDLLEKYLNRTGVRKDDLPRVEELNEEFKDWLCASPLRDEIEELYNRKFRGFVQRDFSNEPIDVPGLANHDKIKDYQWPGLRWALTAGKGIIAADVGLGKTLRGLLLARMAKVEGRAQKPTIVVPKSVLANWYAEADKWFPGSKVLTIGATFQLKDGVLTGKDDDANERKRKYHDLSQNDYDFVIISEPAFEELDLDPVTKNEYYSQDFWVQRGDSLGNAGDKRVKKIRENYEQAIAKREFSDRTDAIYFNDIGIDMLVADEMHHQKNLYAAKNRFGESPKFLGGQGLSNRALDFNLKTRWLLKNHGNKGVYGLTATPTKNSPLEVYSMLCHIAPEAFENIGIRNSEEFLDRFCVFQNDSVLNTRGEIEDALITAGFKNMNELREIMKRYIDRTTAEQVGLVLPKRDDHMHFVEMTPAQEAVYAEYREMLENEAKEKDATGDSHIFSIMDKMNKAAMDLEILDPVAHKGQPSPKYKSLAKHVAEGVRDGGQVVFADYIDAHDKIVDALVASGIKREHIGVINAQVAGSAVKRQNIADKFNAGKLKVVIGNTATMGEGINLQMGTADIHHLDLPWEPASMQQRNGRGLRQGNIKESIRIHTYLSKGSFDGYRYQSIAAKKDWQDLLWSGGDRVDNLAREGKFSRQDIQIMMAADPDAAREKFENDKAAAMAQHESGERVKAAEVFVRFQELKAGYKSLKNKGTASAARLKKKMDDARTSLKANRFFTAKDALDSDEAVVIQPQTGQPFHAGVAFHAKADDGTSEGKFVVTGVDLRGGTVTVRPYAATDGGRKKTVSLEKLAHGVTPFAFDAESEGREVAAAIEKAASEKVNSITSFSDVMKMPPAVLAAAHDSIQSQLKEGAKSYKVRFDSAGKIPMIHKETGELKMVESYEHAKMGDTHDYLIPTDENRQKVEQAWKDAERGAKFSTGTLTTGRRNSQKYVTTAEKRYPGTSYNDKATNPWSRLYTEMNGGSSAGYYGQGDTPQVRELRQKHEAEQLVRVRRAPSFKAALAEAMPLGTVSDKSAGHSAKVKLPKRALAMLWAKARHDGVLGDKIEDHEPRDEGMKYGKHASFALPAREDRDVHSALIKMARAGGYEDLAAAMAESGGRHHKGEDPGQTLRTLTEGFGIGVPALKAALSAAERAGLAETKIRDLGHREGLLQYQQWGGNADKTVREVINERIAYNEQQNIKKEVA
jgi:SNF2 family DNA or RNA helicase/predicted RNA methylase